VQRGRSRRRNTNSASTELAIQSIIHRMQRQQQQVPYSWYTGGVATGDWLGRLIRDDPRGTYIHTGRHRLAEPRYAARPPQATFLHARTARHGTASISLGWRAARSEKKMKVDHAVCACVFVCVCWWNVCRPGTVVCRSLWPAFYLVLHIPFTHCESRFVVGFRHAASLSGKQCFDVVGRTTGMTSDCKELSQQQSLKFFIEDVWGPAV